jgi:hypothetical protein
MICDVPINNSSSSSSSSDEEKSNANSNMIHDYYSCRRCTQLQPELKQCKFSEHCRTPQEQSTKPLARVAEHSRAPLAAGAHAVCTSSAAVAETSHRRRRNRRRLQSPRHADGITIRYTRHGVPFQTVSGILHGSCWTSRTFYFASP